MPLPHATLTLAATVEELGSPHLFTVDPFDCWSRGLYMAAANEKPLLRGRPEKGTHEYPAAK